MERTETISLGMGDIKNIKKGAVDDQEGADIFAFRITPSACVSTVQEWSWLSLSELTG